MIRRLLDQLHREGHLQRTWWPAGGRVALAVGFYPTWRGFRLAITDNGGRLAHECLDLQAQIAVFHVGLTLFGIGRLALLTRHIPRGPRGRGYVLGWLPREY